MNQVTVKRFMENKYVAITTDSSDKAMEILKKEKIDLNTNGYINQGVRMDWNLQRN